MIEDFDLPFQDVIDSLPVLPVRISQPSRPKGINSTERARMYNPGELRRQQLFNSIMAESPDLSKEAIHGLKSARKAQLFG